MSMGSDEINQDESARGHAELSPPKKKSKYDNKLEESAGVRVPVYAAKVVQLRKPSGEKSSAKVVHGIMEVIEGEFSGKRGFFQSSTAYVWGYCLSRANLMYNIKA